MTRITKNERDLLLDLDRILACADLYIDVWGNECMKQKPQLRTSVSWNNFILMTHNAHSVAILLRKKQIYSANSLTRIILEQWINMNYFYLTKTYESLVHYLYSGDKSFIDNVEKSRTFFKRSNYSGNFTDTDFDEIRAFRDDSMSDLKKYGFKLKVMPDIRTRAEQIDKNNDNNELLHLYISWYLNNSMNIHSSKDILIAMTHAESYEEICTGYGLISENDFSMPAFLTCQLLSSAMFFIQSKSKLQRPILNREVVIAYNAYTL